MLAALALSSKLISWSGMTDMELCNIETFRWALFSYVLLDCTPLSIYVSCHTCYYFGFSVTTKKGALLFCVPYTTQMQGPLPEQCAGPFRSLNLSVTFITNQQLSNIALKKQKITSNENNSTFTVYYKNSGTWSLEKKKKDRINQLCVESEKC